MAGKSSTVTVQILADADQYKREMGGVAQTTDRTGKQVEGSADSMGKKMSTFAKVAVAAVAVQALGAVKQFVGDSVRAFSDLNESLNAVEVTFGDSAEGILRLGRSAATNIGMSNAQFNTFAVSMSAFAKQIAGDSGDVVGVMDEMTTRIADFASVMNLDVAEAQEKFQSGLAGESEPLRKFGIDVSAAKVEAFALAEGIWDGVGAMSESEKVQARYGTIMEQTSTVQGDFAATAGDLANAQRIAEAQIENNKALIGGAFKSAVQAAIPLTVSLSNAVAGLAVSALQQSGAMSEAEAATARYTMATGEAISTVEDLIAAVDLHIEAEERREQQRASREGGDVAELDRGNEFIAMIQEMIATQALAEDEAQQWLDQLEKFPDTFNLSEEELSGLVGTIKQYQTDTDRGRFATDAHAAAIRSQMIPALEEVEEAQADVNFELQVNRDLVRAAFDFEKQQTDALYRVEAATRDQADAQALVNQMQADNLTETPEYLQAIKDLDAANVDLRDAELALTEQGALTREEFVNQRISLGLTRAEAELLAAEYDDLFTERTVTHTIRIKRDEPTAANPSRVPGNAQHGGRIHGPTIVGEAGPEVFVPDSAGTVIPNHRLGNGNGNGSPLGGTTIYLSVSSLDPQAAGRAVVEALQSWQRSNGDIPITVRG